VLVVGGEIVRAAQLKTADQRPTVRGVARAGGDKGSLGARCREQRNVPGHQDDIKGAVERQAAHVGDMPLEGGAEAAGCRDHRSIGVDADHVDLARGQLSGHPPSAAAHIEHRAGTQCRHEVGLPVDVGAGSGALVETSLVSVPVPHHAVSTPAIEATT